MDQIAFELSFWHWWILAIALAAVEILAPGVFFLWLALAAGLVGGVALIFPDLPWQGQLLTFGILSVICAVIGRRVYGRLGAQESDQPGLNRRAEQFVGRVFVLDQPIVNGAGRLKIGDGAWKIAGPDLPQGAKVEVIAADGIVLKVQQKADADQPAQTVQ